MSWPDIVDQINEAVIAAFAVPATYQKAPAAAVAVRIVLTRASMPIFAGGEISLDEDHYTGQLSAADLTGAPAEGAIITVGSDSYRVERPGTYQDGLWRLTLRKR